MGQEKIAVQLFYAYFSLYDQPSPIIFIVSPSNQDEFFTVPAEPTYNETVLMQQVAAGNETAFRQLFDQYRQKIYSLAMYLTRSEVLSEEIVQDVFMKVWSNRDQLHQIDYFNAWLRTIARNTISNYLRGLARERLALSRLDVTKNDSTLSSENIFLDRQYQQLMQEAIRQLPAQQQKAFLLSRQAGLKNEEIARQMGISIHTTKEHLQRATRSIRQYLDARIELSVVTAVSLYLLS